MDGYLSKPIQAREMLAMVERLASGMPAAETEPREPISSPATAVFNPREAITRCYNSEKMLRNMIQCFFDEAETLFPQMRAALEKGDLEEVGRLGHRMKGTVAYLGAEPAKEAAAGVERFSKDSGGTASEAEEAINALERACEVLKRELAGHPLTGQRAQGA
jgi:HPt (histidine-containing phosphotransfer) domain-containing protein